MQKQVEAWQRSELTDVTARVVIYEAFVEARLEAPKHLARTVHDLYFEPSLGSWMPGDPRRRATSGRHRIRRSASSGRIVEK